jgi:hypothetical protein
LNLQDVIVSKLDDSVTLTQSGLIGDLPGGIQLNEYQKRLALLRDQLKSLPEGRGTDSEFEEVVGDILRLCFYKVLTNIEPKVRTADGRVIRDWIAANHAPDGFWELVRNRYAATQLIWECKNYSTLQASDFQQAAYYMTEPIGRFSILAFRGNEKKRHYYEHIKRIASDKNGIVLLFHDKDLDVFLRHAMSGKSNEPHLREIYDTTVREIS